MSNAQSPSLKSLPVAQIWFVLLLATPAALAWPVLLDGVVASATALQIQPLASLSVVAALTLTLICVCLRASTEEKSDHPPLSDRLLSVWLAVLVAVGFGVLIDDLDRLDSQPQAGVPFAAWLDGETREGIQTHGFITYWNRQVAREGALTRQVSKPLCERLYSLTAAPTTQYSLTLDGKPMISASQCGWGLNKMVWAPRTPLAVRQPAI